MYVKRSTLKATLPAASKDETRYNLNAIHVEPGDGGVFTATDGHRLHQVRQASVAAEDYPSCGVDERPELEKDFLLPLDGAKELERIMPKGKKLMPILRDRALVDTRETNQNGHARFVATDLKQTRPLQVEKIDGEYPNIDRVMPKDAPEGAITFGVNATYLADALKAAALIGQAVKVTVRGPLEPIEVRATDPENGDEFVALVMPMRLA